MSVHSWSHSDFLYYFHLYFSEFSFIQQAMQYLLCGDLCTIDGHMV